jgi:hypothetical protein
MAMNSMMMQAVRTSETSVYSETARRNIPEGSQLPAVSIFVYYSYSVLFHFVQKLHEMFLTLKLVTAKYTEPRCLQASIPALYSEGAVLKSRPENRLSVRTSIGIIRKISHDCFLILTFQFTLTHFHVIRCNTNVANKSVVKLTTSYKQCIA